ncbi:hypothetical protein V5N11_003587 [Cardamine amara subsp. amara]|uniref:Endonuclease/exonuclease/phosphatase domain-containing protein n=1 Tax=Cardamine amara subsp. amara TaxID=228776 RepID=A0ABD1AI69_CARAN
MTKFCRGWKFTSNHLADAEGRIIIIWQDQVQVRVIHQSKQSLTCEVKIQNTHVFIYTAIYAFNTREERVNLWVELLDLQQSLLFFNRPWMMGGDFNEIVHPEEHSLPEVTTLAP